jgi:sugar lactone lactonase YvrE
MPATGRICRQTGHWEGLDGIRNLPDVGPGPESVAIGPDGRLYTGLQDGRVVRMLADGTGVETFVQTGGRSLGMKFDAGGNLIVADAFRGLLRVSPERKITVLADTVNGERMLFPNDLAISADGTLWFSDASRRFDPFLLLFAVVFDLEKATRFAGSGARSD